MDDTLRRNRLLAGLPGSVLEPLADDLVRREIEAGQLLVAQGERANSIWFPLSGAVSLTPETREGGSVQVGVVGREGMVELTAALGAGGAPWRALVQLPGSAAVIDTDRFRAHLGHHRALLSVAHVYACAAIAQIAQSTLCSRFHSVRQRAARWLLVLHDRADDERFPITQQFLADMVGAHRPTISLTAQLFAEEGLITYSRGSVVVVDRAGLEAAACECYARADAALAG